MAVEVEWIDSTSPRATGNKIYRDTVPSTGEVEIAGIANGVQFYSDGTVDAGAEYKYEVQAHDGAGDETTKEEEGTNMDYITTEAAAGNPELFPQDNAASIDTEINAVPLPTVDTANGTVASVDSGVITPDSGLYSVEMTSAGDGVLVFSPGVVTEVGATYEVSIAACKGAGISSPPRFNVWEGFSDFSIQYIEQELLFETFTWTLTGDGSTIKVRIYFNEATPDVKCYVDSITIKKV